MRRTVVEPPAMAEEVISSIRTMTLDPIEHLDDAGRIEDDRRRRGHHLSARPAFTRSVNRTGFNAMFLLSSSI